MPLYPSENMPMSLIRHHITPARINENLSELTRNGKPTQRKISEHTILSASENSDAIKGLCIPPAMHVTGTLSKQVQFYFEIGIRFYSGDDLIVSNPVVYVWMI